MSRDHERLYEEAPCGLVSTAPDGRISRVNGTFVAWTGIARDELIGRQFVTLLDPGSRIFYETRYLPTLELNGAVHEIALTLLRADDEPLAALINSTTVRNADGEAIGTDSAVFDSTRRQDYERQLLAARRAAEASEARTRSLQAASAAFVGCETPEALAQALADSVKGAFSASEVAVHLVTDGALHLSGGSQPFEVWDALAGVRLRDTVVRVTVSDPTASERVIAALDASRIEELTLVPLLEGDRVIGSVTSFFGRTREPDPAAAELQYALARQASQVLRRIRLQNELEAIALYDPLTGLANRALLRTRLTTALGEAASLRQPISVLFVDLDGFKEINDEFDHTVGDAVLQEVSHRLSESVRQDDLVGRFGGDEFLIVCANTDGTAATAVAERIREAVKAPMTGIAAGVLTASIGVAVHLPDDAVPPTPSDVVRIADAAMYEAKDSGKDKVRLASV
ncbi:diguanylate cyclase [Leifsonia sp. NPDC058230]|uniref:sensor domain-containing protein n=1 Tax=Leifsonia sp. NPDC058230 TaxID=3346391 RepID=UPI0036DBC825